MTVASSTSRVTYAGNGSTVTFTVPFYFLANTHIKVVLLSASGIETTKTLTTDYTVSGAGTPSGGSITMIVAPASGETLSILRNVPYTQETDYQSNDPFPAETHERALDKLTMETQQLAEQANRALTLPASLSGGNTTLPAPESNSLIGWNESLTGLQNVDPLTLVTLVSYGTAKADIFNGDGTTTQFTLTASPGALNNLDVSISGVTQKPGIDYTWSSGTTITFTSAPPVGTNNVLCRYLQALPQGASDSAASTFIQSGTGAVTRTGQDKMRDMVSVKDFGAKGDGVTDDYAAIQAAITYASANSKSIYFPDGSYKTNTGILLYPTCGVDQSGNAKIVGAAGIVTVTLTAGNYCGLVMNLPTITGGSTALKLLGVSLATVSIPSVAGATDGIVLEVTNSNLVTADNTIRFTSIFGMSAAAIKFNYLATTKTNVLMQGNAFYGNFITSVKYAIHFYDVNNNALGQALAWDDTYFEIMAIDPNVTGSIGIFGEPNLPPGRCIYNVPTFFGGCDTALIKNTGGNYNLFRLAISGTPTYSQMQLGGLHRIINIGTTQSGIRGVTTPVALSSTTNTIGTFNGGVAIPVNRFLASLAIGSQLSGVSITGTAGQFSCAAASLAVGQPVTITGTFGGTGSITGYVAGTTYYIIATNGSTTFTLSASLGGAAITTTAGTPTGLTYSAGLGLSQQQVFNFFHPYILPYGCKVVVEPLWTALLTVIIAAENSTAGAGISGLGIPSSFQGGVMVAGLGPVNYGTYSCFITVHDAPQ